VLSKGQSRHDAQCRSGLLRCARNDWGWKRRAISRRRAIGGHRAVAARTKTRRHCGFCEARVVHDPPQDAHSCEVGKCFRAGEVHEPQARQARRPAGRSGRSQAARMCGARRMRGENRKLWSRKMLSGPDCKGSMNYKNLNLSVQRTARYCFQRIFDALL